LYKAAELIFNTNLRDSTHRNYVQGIKHYTDFCTLVDLSPFPSSVEKIVLFATYSIAWSKLDSSTVTGRISALSAWHDYVSALWALHAPRQNWSLFNPCKSARVRDLITGISANLKKKSRARSFLTMAEVHTLWHKSLLPTGAREMHHRLGFMLLIFAMLRQRAAVLLIIRYTIVIAAGQLPLIIYHADSDIRVVRNDPELGPHIVINVDVDKNVNSTSARLAYLPEAIPDMGIFPIDVLESYLLRVRPPSGGFLLAAPKGLKNHTFFTNPFTGMAGVFIKAFKKAFPNSPKQEFIGSHSGRKSLAQALWDMGLCRRFIADVGGWFIKHDAVDIYFKTRPFAILAALRALSPFAGPSLNLRP